MTGPIDPRLLEDLRRDREAPGPQDVQARIAARLGLADGGSSLTRAAGTAGHLRISATRAVAALGAAFVAGAAVGMLLHARLDGVPATRVVYVDRPVPVSSAPGTVEVPPSPPPAAKTAEAPPPSVPAATVVRTPAPMASAAQLDAERALLDEARAALVREESDVALSALDRYAKTYRHPQLAEEHDALVVQALVRSKRYDEARARAGAFHRAHPQSLLSPAVDAAIATIP